jgi:hypothetical protein
MRLFFERLAQVHSFFSNHSSILYSVDATDNQSQVCQVAVISCEEPD